MLLQIKMLMNRRKKTLVSFFLDEVKALTQAHPGLKLSLTTQNGEWAVALFDHQRQVASNILVADSKNEAKQVLEFIQERI